MDDHVHSCPSTILSVVSLIITTTFINLSMAQRNDTSFYYNMCAPYTCGNTTISLPFSSSEPFCGPLGFEVICDPSTSIPSITISGHSYQVSSIFINDSIIVVHDVELTTLLSSNSCYADVSDHFLPAAKFDPFNPSWDGKVNFSLCNVSSSVPLSFGNHADSLISCGNQTLYLFWPNGSLNGDSVLPVKECVHTELPVQLAALSHHGMHVGNMDELLAVLADGFFLQWNFNMAACWECKSGGG